MASSADTALGPSAPTNAQSEELVLRAKQAFRAIEPWCHARSDSITPEVDHILKNARVQASAYIQAIDNSLVVSQDGTAFAQDALRLCTYINDGVEPQTLLSYIGYLLRLAEEGHKKAEEVTSAFRCIWCEIIKVTNDIISATSAVSDNRRKFQRSAAAFSFGANVAAHVYRICKPMGKGSVAFAAAFPHFCIILPVALPLLEVAASRIKSTLEDRAQARNQQVLSCDQALDQLWDINRDLMALSLGTEGFVRWWSSVKITLGNLQSHVPPNHREGARPLSIDMIEKNWRCILRDYTLYTREIRRLQDVYRPAIEYLTAQEITRNESIAMTPETSSGPERPGDFADISSTLRLLAELGNEWRKTFADLRCTCDSAIARKCSLDLCRLKNNIDDLDRSIRQDIWTDLCIYLVNIHPLFDKIRLRTPDVESSQTVFSTPENWQCIVASASRAQELYKRIVCASRKLPSSVVAWPRFPNLLQLDEVVRSLQLILSGISTSVRALVDFFVTPQAIMRALGDSCNGGPGSWDEDTRRCITAFS